MSEDERDTIRCSPEEPTIPAQAPSCAAEPEVPRDSEWAGFSTEMAAILAEILEAECKICS
jgi:hypothetical protein